MACAPFRFKSADSGSSHQCPRAGWYPAQKLGGVISRGKERRFLPLGAGWQTPLPKSFNHNGRFSASGLCGPAIPLARAVTGYPPSGLAGSEERNLRCLRSAVR